MYTKPVAIVPSEVKFAPRGWFEGLRITGAAIRTPRRSRMELVQLRATDPVLQHRDAWPPRAP
jgi:hypothetical protein